MEDKYEARRFEDHRDMVAGYLTKEDFAHRVEHTQWEGDFYRGAMMDLEN